MDNLFLQATREKFRFESSKGDLSVEQLWDLPLTSRTGFDLDTVAKAVNKFVGALEEHDDVQDVYTNMDIDDAIAAQLEDE